MAPPSKCMLIMLLVTFAVVAPSLPPSAAARDGGLAKDAAAAAPAPSANGEAVHPMGLIDDIIGGITHLPDLPLPRILPCPPDFPIKIPLIPCYNVTPPAPPVTECRSSLVKKLMPACGGFLTNSSSVMSPPSKKCCNALPTLFDDSSPFCLCHVVNGDADDLLPAPANHTRALNFMNECGYNLSPENVIDVCEEAKGNDRVPPMDAPSPPPRRQGTN